MTTSTGSARGLSDAELADIYRDLHANPELSHQETRTANIVASKLREWGYVVTTDIGSTGVVGVLDNGPGPTALLRADMDGLPLLEKTGLDYASTARATDRLGNDVPIMHACGHDVHVTCMLGAASILATERESFSGRLMVLFQPAEEVGSGAQGMVEDGLFDRVGKPDVVLGQHVSPMPAGMIAMHA
ncbi:MAG: M20/M25/M40 family metallo-hydrolase, partial [Antricoccus sp.]